jgi:SOS-response transcriptional repressor LexA
MIEAHICDGDITIFHPGETSGSGIFVVAIGNSLVVKRVGPCHSDYRIV